MSINCQTFDLAEKVNLYTLTNETKSLTVKISDYGATIVQILFNDRENIERDLVLGFDDLNGYKSSLNQYFGATIGRVANRIANGSFELNGQRYNLYKNNGPNSLHGGLVGFDKRKWKLAPKSDDSDDNDCLALQYTSYDNEEGYPGTLETVVRFRVTNSNELKINYQSKLRVDHNSGPKKQTIVSLTNHSYFNLNGVQSPESASILDHKVRLYSSEYLEIDGNSIPTGKILSVEGTPLQLNKHDQPALAIGDQNFQYDHCLILDNDPSKWEDLQKRYSRPDSCQVKIGAEVFAPRTGIKMTYETDEPSFQFYSGGHLLQGLRPKRSQSADQTFTFGPNSGFCLESQRFVNAINVDPWRVQMILDHNQIYTQNTVYKFEIKDQI